MFLIKKKKWLHQINLILNEVPGAVGLAGYIIWENTGVYFGYCLLLPSV